MKTTSFTRAFVGTRFTKVFAAFSKLFCASFDQINPHILQVYLFVSWDWITYIKKKNDISLFEKFFVKGQAFIKLSFLRWTLFSSPINVCFKQQNSLFVFVKFRRFIRISKFSFAIFRNDCKTNSDVALLSCFRWLRRFSVYESAMFKFDVLYIEIRTYFSVN